jgi:hypothetical protein
MLVARTEEHNPKDLRPETPDSERKTTGVRIEQFCDAIFTSPTFDE